VGIGRRLDRLEARQGGCRECGWGSPDVAYEVIWDDGWSEVPEEREPVICPRCGRPDEIVVVWGDLDEVERKRHEEAQRRFRSIDNGR
jgi:hypothetical protein